MKSREAINSTICLSMLAERHEKFSRNPKVSRCADDEINAANVKVYTSFNYILMTQFLPSSNSVNSSAASPRLSWEIIFCTQTITQSSVGFVCELFEVSWPSKVLCIFCAFSWFAVGFGYVTSNLSFSSCIFFSRCLSLSLRMKRIQKVDFLWHRIIFHSWTSSKLFHFAWKSCCCGVSCSYEQRVWWKWIALTTGEAFRTWHKTNLTENSSNSKSSARNIAS